MYRRNLVKVLFAIPVMGGLVRSAAVFAGWNVEAFSAVNEEDAVAGLFPGQEISESEEIDIGVRDLVENGAVVPIKIRSDLPGISSISIVVEKNPNPLIAHFELSSQCRAFVATRIKVGTPSDVVAIVQSQGKLYSRRKFVEVVEGGCG